MKVLGILPHSIGGRLTISSIFDGFRQLNADLCVFDQLKDTDFLEFVSDKEFDFLVGYDFSALQLKVDNNLNIPSINYFSDVIDTNASGLSEEREKYIAHLNSPGNFTFYWDKALAEKYGYNYMPHFVNCEIYKDLELPKKFDIMFAGRLDNEYRLNFFTDLMKSFPNLTFAWFAIERHFQDALSRTEEKDLLTKAYKGFIDNETNMAIALNQSRIVFNINSQGESSLNYRTFQTMACKTLLISDFRSEINLFNGDLPFYNDFQDLTNKINYYLENPQTYEQTVNKCLEHILKNHNAKDCVKKMLLSAT